MVLFPNQHKSYNRLNKGKLILENGVIFEGKIFGYEGSTTGEVVFNTSLTGYQEILTDPSYYGQIVTMTYPLIGNYGVNNTDTESDKVQVKGLVVGNYENEWSNYGGLDSLEDYLKQNKVTAITGIDTRALTKMIRSEGAMRGLITNENLSEKNYLGKIEASPLMSGSDLVQYVTAKKNYTHRSEKPGKKIAVYDFGIKKNILREFLNYEVELNIFNAKTPAEDVLASEPDGIFLSNGPGDPDAVKYAVENVKIISGSGIPLFGICLGHQLLALAHGAKTYKLKFGHRGANHPVKNHELDRIEITSQNHGFAVDPKSIDDDILEITHTNLYDGTNEGLRHKKFPLMSVQYHPEASPGPNDSKYLFEEFMGMVEKQTGG